MSEPQYIIWYNPDLRQHIQSFYSDNGDNAAAKNMFFVFIHRPDIQITQNSIIKACKNGHIEMIKYLLERHEEWIEIALYTACENGLEDIVSMIYSTYNIPIIITEKCNEIACKNEHYSISRLLSKHCNAQDALSIIDNLEVSDANPELAGIIRKIYPEANWETMLPIFLTACSTGNEALVKFGLFFGRLFNGNVLTFDPTSPCMVPYHGDRYDEGLYIACENGHMNIVSMLLDNHVVPTQKALEISQQKGHEQIAKLLQSRMDEYEAGRKRMSEIASGIHRLLQ